MLLSQQNIGLVVISNILDLFMDSEVDLKETKHTVNFLTSFLVQLAREERIALVATCSTQINRNSALLHQFLTSRAQVVLRAEQRAREVHFTVEKHPIKQPATRTISLSASKVL